MTLRVNEHKQTQQTKEVPRMNKYNQQLLPNICLSNEALCCLRARPIIPMTKHGYQ